MPYVHAGDSPDHADKYLYAPGGLGLLGSLVPDTGEGGRPGLLYNDVVASGWESNEVRCYLVSSTFPSLFIDNDSSWTATGLSDGTFTATIRVYLDGVSQGTSTFTLTIGEFAVNASITMVEDGDDIVAGFASVNTPVGGTVDAAIAMVELGDDVPAASAQITGGNVQIPGPDPYPIMVWPDNSLGGSSSERRYKQPAEVMDFDFDYSRWFSRRTDEPFTQEVDVDAGLTKINSWLLGDRIKVQVSGGTNRARYKVTARMTTTSGAVEEAECYVVIKET